MAVAAIQREITQRWKGISSLPIVVTAELLISEFPLPLVVCVLIWRKCRSVSVFTFCWKKKQRLTIRTLWAEREGPPQDSQHTPDHGKSAGKHFLLLDFTPATVTCFKGSRRSRCKFVFLTLPIIQPCLGFQDVWSYIHLFLFSLDIPQLPIIVGC